MAETYTTINAISVLLEAADVTTTATSLKIEAAVVLAVVVVPAVVCSYLPDIIN